MAKAKPHAAQVKASAKKVDAVIRSEVRKALPGHAKAHKHAVPNRGETIKTPDIIGSWSAR